MNFTDPYLTARFSEVEDALTRAAQWGSSDRVINAYLAGYLVVMTCGIFEDSIEHMVKTRANRPGDLELYTFVASTVHERFRNPDNGAILGLLKQFSSAYQSTYRNSISTSASTAVDSVVNNKNWLAHGETSKMQLTVSDVQDYFVRCLPAFEALEQILS